MDIIDNKALVIIEREIDRMIEKSTTCPLSIEDARQLQIYMDQKAKILGKVETKRIIIDDGSGLTEEDLLEELNKIQQEREDDEE